MAVDSSAGSTLVRSVETLLRAVPERWTEYDPDTLTESESNAVRLLTAAGMIERRVTLRLRRFDHPVAIEAVLTFTGEGGFAEAIEYVSSAMWQQWRDAFERQQSGDSTDAKSSHCERLGKESWRLTSEGVIARGDLDGEGSEGVFEFVLKRGFFDGRPRRLPDGRISQRLPVRGHGKVVRMEILNLSGSAAPQVNIGNWEEGGRAFASAFANAASTLARPPIDEPENAYHPGLWQIAKSKGLIGNERKAVSKICISGTVKLADLGAAFGWSNPPDDWNSLRKRLNDKFERDGWEFYRSDGCATVRQVPTC